MTNFDVDDFVDSFMEEIPNTKFEFQPRKDEFRVSGLPYCGVLSLYNSLSEKKGASYSMEHYTTIGTTIHNNIQTWASLNPKTVKYMFGNWECVGCHSKKEWCHVPKKCDCKTPYSYWKYVELEIAWKNLSGHIDLVLKLPTKQYIVVDFKTTSMQSKRDKRKWDVQSYLTPSSPNYIAQIRSYCTLLELVYGMDISHWVIVNVDRDKPLGSKPSSHATISSKWSTAKSNKWFEYLEKSNKSYESYKAFLAEVDTGNSDKSQLKFDSMIKQRLCRSEEDYAAYMRYKFYGKEECPLKNSCLKHSKYVKKDITLLLGNTE
jgi:hypothetical protein